MSSSPLPNSSTDATNEATTSSATPHELVAPAPTSTPSSTTSTDSHTTLTTAVHELQDVEYDVDVAAMAAAVTMATAAEVELAKGASTPLESLTGASINNAVDAAKRAPSPHRAVQARAVAVAARAAAPSSAHTAATMAAMAAATTPAPAAAVAAAAVAAAVASSPSTSGRRGTKRANANVGAAMVMASPVRGQSPTPPAIITASTGMPVAVPDQQQPVSLYRGQTFESGKAAYHTVQDYAFYQNKQVKMQSRGGNHKKVLCTSEACPFFVQLYRKLSKADSKSWYVSSLNLQHMNCSSVAKPTKRQLAELPAFRNAVLGAPDAAIGHLIRQMQGEEGIALQKRLRTVYRARDAIKEAIASDNAALYKKIPSLMREFMRLNPRSCALLDRDEQGRFQRAFLASEVFIDAFPHNQRMLGLTSTLFDCSDFHGVQLLLHARDGNFGHIKMAMAIVDAETQENYEWFLTTVVESARLHGLQSVPILCEPVHELVSAAKKLNLLLCFANAQDLQPSYGWQPATFVRTEGMIVPKESPFMHLQNMMSELMKEAFERHRTSVKWQDEGRKVTPQAELLFQQQLKEVGRFVVEECSESIAFVYDAAQVPRNRVRVDLATCSCSCMYMAQFEIPCKHLLALLSHNNTLDKAFEFFGACFQVHNYAASYRSKCVQIPIDSDLVNDDSVHPPKKQRKGGRGRSPGTPGTPTGAGAAGFSATALAEAGSVASKVGGAAARAARGVERSGETKVYRCGNCGRDGHNKRSCEALGAQTTTQCDLEQFSQVI